MNYIEMKERAKKLYNERYISPFMEVAGVTCVLETKNGNIYEGVNIDADCGIGMCAERNACGTMLTHGESEITKLLCYKDGKLILPCGVCREFLLQLNENNKDMKIVLDAENGEFVTLKELMPSWWGYSKYKNGISKKKWGR